MKNSIYILRFRIENKPGATEEFAILQECEVNGPIIKDGEIDAILNHFAEFYNCIIGEVYGIYKLTKIL